MGKHTPTPWAVRHKRSIFPIGEASLAIAVAEQHRPEAEASAAFIVRAVNSHDELLAALRDMVDYREWLTEVVLHRARAAIAKAEGRE